MRIKRASIAKRRFEPVCIGQQDTHVCGHRQDSMSRILSLERELELFDDIELWRHRCESLCCLCL
eukprot:3118965-Pleurochrysis_carterae.AAC.1